MSAAAAHTAAPGRIGYCVGIDLGSTTTKAVVLGEDGSVLGRGITNSRSNYDAACGVALGEALTHARFALLHDLLPPSERHVLPRFELAFREQQYRSQLRALAASIESHVRHAGVTEATATSASSVLAAMEARAGELFAPGVVRRSDFFRDLAGSQFLALAEEQAREQGVAFDALVALYDKAILEVENSAAAAGTFAPLARAALSAAAPAANDTGVPRRNGASPALARAVEAALATELHQLASVGTGYGRQRLPFPEGQIRSEILCHGLGAHRFYPGSRTILDIGGQDTKAIQVDEHGIVTSFQMNDRCAAGCGRYLGYIAEEMNLGLHELGPLAGRATRRVRINSTCTVFAGAELRERLSLGERREDILAGLHRAIVLRAVSLLARSGGVHEEFTFTGGVAKNPEAVAVLTSLIAENWGERTINISPDSIYTGALGAALFALRDLRRDGPRRADHVAPAAGAPLQEAEGNG